MVVCGCPLPQNSDEGSNGEDEFYGAQCGPEGLFIRKKNKTKVVTNLKFETLHLSFDRELGKKTK